jgi:hypothetical protein
LSNFAADCRAIALMRVFPEPLETSTQRGRVTLPSGNATAYLATQIADCLQQSLPNSDMTLAAIRRPNLAMGENRNEGNRLRKDDAQPVLMWHDRDACADAGQYSGA